MWRALHLGPGELRAKLKFIMAPFLRALDCGSPFFQGFPRFYPCLAGARRYTNPLNHRGISQMAEKVKLSKDGSSIDFVQSDSLPTSLKKFRQSPEIEGFYRFIFENDLQKEAYEILDRIIFQRKAKKAGAKKEAQAAAKEEKAAAKKEAAAKGKKK